MTGSYSHNLIKLNYFAAVCHVVVLFRSRIIDKLRNYWYILWYFVNFSSVCVCVESQRIPFAAKNRPESNQWFHRDIDAMCHQLNTDPIFIDADRSMTFTVTVKTHIFWSFFLLMTLVLWCCWLGTKKSIWPVRNCVMRCWRCYLSAARCKWIVYDPADATTTPSSVASLKSILVYTFWCCLTHVILEKRPLNGCLSFY